VTFETMGEHAFEDARSRTRAPFNQKAYQGASVLVAPELRCGSSREHALKPMRLGHRAIVGGSFGEIFFGNCVMLGIPVTTASQEDVECCRRRSRGRRSRR